MTLNDLERRNSPYFAFFSRNSTDFQADYITVVEDRPNVRKIHVLSPSSILLLLAKSITHPAARSLCDSWASCLKSHGCSEEKWGLEPPPSNPRDFATAHSRRCSRCILRPADLRRASVLIVAPFQSPAHNFIIAAARSSNTKITFANKI